MMSILAKAGEKVTFNPGNNGTDGDRNQALAALIEGCTYTVKFVHVFNWCSYVELQEVPGSFNTVLFD